MKPGCGRLVGFSSGPVNPHGVTAVTGGRRCALALWFTKEKLYRDMVSVTMMSRSGELCRSHPLHHVTTAALVSKQAVMQMWRSSSRAMTFTFPSGWSFQASFIASSHVCSDKTKSKISKVVVAVSCV